MTTSVEAGAPAELGYRLIGPSWHSAGPPVVLVHGTNRRLNALSGAFAPFAEWAGIPLLLPDFSRPAFVGYQRLRGARGPLAAADALDALLAKLGWIDQPIDLVGFSGGAQFAHRYALVSAVSIRRAVIAAAGWYTVLDPATRFPVGIGDGPELMGRSVNVDALLRLPLRIMVGEQDTARDRHLRTGPTFDAQGLNRLERARHWHRHLEAEAARHGVVCRASFESLPSTGHAVRRTSDGGGYVHRVAAYLNESQPPGDSPGTNPP